MRFWTSVTSPLVAKLGLMSFLICPSAFAQIEWIDGPDTEWGRGHRYALTERGTWTDVEAIAVAAGGHLVTINCEEENTWLFNTFRDTMSGDSNVAWIGMTDAAEEGHWLWIAGDGGWFERNNPVSTSYTNWYGNEPSGGTREQHATIYMHSDAAHEQRWCDHGPADWQGIIEMATTSNVPIGYVALGDSYSSGEGAGLYEDPDKTDSPDCHRSELAFSGAALLMVEDLGFTASRSFFACSGAETKHVLNTRFTKGDRDEDPQLSHPELNSSTDLVTISIGGNDVGFGPVLTAAATNTNYFDNQVCVNWGGVVYGCLEWRTNRTVAEEAIDGLEGTLTDLFDQIKSSASEYTEVFVMGYPRLFPSNREDQLCEGVLQNFDPPGPFYGINGWEPEEQEDANALADRFNAVLEQAADAAGSHFVNPAVEFAGHEVCGPKPDWIWGPLRADGQERFHPNSLGHLGYKSAFKKYVQRWIADDKPLNAVGLPMWSASKSLLTPVQTTSTMGGLLISPVSAASCESKDSYILAEDVLVSGDGFGENSPVLIEIVGPNQTVMLSDSTADSSGKLSSVVSLPNSTDFAGWVTMRAVGTGSNGYTRILLESLEIGESLVGDTDSDSVPDLCDNCFETQNTDQEDLDSDGLGDACDPCPNDDQNDIDSDGLCGDVDPCPLDTTNTVDSDGNCFNVNGIFMDGFESSNTDGWSATAPSS